MTGDHLDDDALSASLDGEATPAESAHVDSCTTCRARMAELRTAANAIGGPLGAIDDDRRAAAIRTALAAAPTRLESRRRQPPAWAWGAAAAVLVVAVLVPILGRDQNRDTSSQTASGQAKESTADSSAGASTLSAPVAPIDAGDLGAIGGRELRDLVTTALTQSPSAATSASPMADAPASTTGRAGAPPCVDELRENRPELGSLRLVARATSDSVDVHVLAFDVPGEQPSIHAFEVAVNGCAVIRAESFPAP